MPTYVLNVNGVDRQATVSSAEMPLLWVLRDVLNLTGTKYGCGIEALRRLHGDGRRTARTCLRLQRLVGGGQADHHDRRLVGEPQPPGAAGVDRQQVPQCGFCQPGMLMSTACAMKAGHHGSEIASEVKNLCVCGTYPRIKQAIAGL